MTMIPLHRIRLRRPWECARQGPTDLWSRRFGRPARLSSDEEVWLVVEGSPAAAEVRLNGRPLEVPSSGVAGGWDVTAQLDPRNELQIVLPSGPAGDCPPLEVSLEIRLRPLG